MKFLSEEWATALAAAVNANEAFKQAAGNTSARIQQIVTEVPGGGEIDYWVTLEAGAIAAGVGTIDDATVTITQSYETAVALAKGELSGTAAFMGGKVKISNIMKAMGLQGPLQALAPIVREVPCEY